MTYGAGGSTRERTHRTVVRILNETTLKPAAHLTCVEASRGEVDEVIGILHVKDLLEQVTVGGTIDIEKALAELEQIVTRLESGKVDLEQSIAIYERGEALKKHCETLLKAAEARIEKITLKPDGTPSGTEPLDVD